MIYNNVYNVEGAIDVKVNVDVDVVVAHWSMAASIDIITKTC